MESALPQSCSFSLSALKTLSGTILFLTPKYDSNAFQIWGKIRTVPTLLSECNHQKDLLKKHRECSFIGKSKLCVEEDKLAELSAALGRNLGYTSNET